MKTVGVHDEGGQRYAITKLYIAIAEHGPNDESIVSMTIASGSYPILSSKLEIVRKMLGTVRPEHRVKHVRIVCFEGPVTVERAW